LVELLVVIAIIGVLATLILLQLGVARSKARDAKRIADVNQLRTGIEIYFDDHSGSYPGAALCPVAVGGACTIPGLAPNWDGDDLTPYLSARILPKDPLTGNQYSYAWNPTGAVKKSMYSIWTDLEKQNAPALNGDTDINSAAPWGGVGQNNSSALITEDCKDGVPLDCVYDLGQQ